MKAKLPRYTLAFLALTLVGGGAAVMRGQSSTEAEPTVQPLPVFDALQATAEQRRQYIEGLPAVEKERLRRQWERYRELDESVQDRIVRLKQDLSTAPDREELEAVMHRYHNWLAELSTADRAEFLELSPEQRVARIQEQRENERRRASDREAIAAWIEQRLIEQLPPEVQQRLEKLDTRRRRFRLASELARMGKQTRRPPWTRISEEDFLELEATLSEEAQQKLDDLTLQQKRFQLARWMQEFATDYASRVNPGAMRRFFSTLTEEEREAFQRDFSELSREEIQERLEALYLQRNPYDERDFMDSRRFQRPSYPGSRPDSREKPRPPRDRPAKE